MDTQASDQQINPVAINSAKAIRQVESGGDYAVSGKSGEYGAYQFTEPTWNSYSKEYGINTSLQQSTRQQQNEVAVRKINDWITSGKAKNIGEVASMWNAGEEKPQAYLDDNVGINKYGVSYNTPAYAKNVATAYQQIKQQSGQLDEYNPKPFSNPSNSTSSFAVDTSGQTQPADTSQSEDNSLGSELSGRVNDASQAITDAASGKQNWLSGGLQVAGAAAGGVGDIVNKGLELIPGVKAIEGVIGDKVGQLAQTPSGQAIVKSLKDFSTAHPELTKDAGAVFNIATAIPILKGIGVVKDIAFDGASQLLKGTAEKVATRDLTATAARTIGGRGALADAPDAIKTLIDERALPDIEGSKYTTGEAYEKLGQNISSIEDKELQPALKSVSTLGVDTRQPIENLRQQALADVQQEFKAGGNVGKAETEVNRVFDDYKKNYGDYVTLEDVNDMKRGIRKTVNFNSPKLDSDVSYHLGQVFQSNIEESAQKLGLPDVGKINQKMARLIKAQNILKHIEGKPVKQGIVSGMIKDLATGGGELAGNSSGIPLAGAYVGREAGGFVGKKLSGITKGILERTGKNATRQSLGSIAKKSAGLLKGALAQKAVKGK